MSLVLTENFHLNSAVCRVVVFISGCAGVQSLVRDPLHIFNGEGSIMDALSHVGRQPHVILLPDDAVDRITRHGTLDGKHFTGDGRDSSHSADVGHS